MSEEPMPCPFCWHQNLIIEYVDDFKGIIVSCQNCYAEGPAIYKDQDYKNAIKAWNTRAGEKR